MLKDLYDGRGALKDLYDGRGALKDLYDGRGALKDLYDGRGVLKDLSVLKRQKQEREREESLLSNWAHCLRLLHLEVDITSAEV